MRLLPFVAFSTLLACSRPDPPGAEKARETKLVGSPSSSGSAAVPEALKLGSASDALPFSPTGKRLVSIAWRTWIYTDTEARRERYGYLRAGAVVDARDPPIVNDSCEGGWYRINPRGFVCVGMGASLDLKHPVATASTVRPVRGAGLPYIYAMAEDVAPLLYFRLPTAAEAKDSEGPGFEERVASYKDRITRDGLATVLGELGAPPDFLAGGRAIEKPYGAVQGLRYSAHMGRAAAGSGFAFARAFDWQGRWYGLTTELDVVGLERTRLVRSSTLRGVVLPRDAGLPVAFVTSRFSMRYAQTPTGEFKPNGTFGYREGLHLTGRDSVGGMVEADGGVWAVDSTLRRIEPRTAFPSIASGDRKWIDISIQAQSLVAYEGQRPVFATLVSTGIGGMGDPATTNATVRGTFMIYSKEISSTMDGDIVQATADSYALRDVPFVQYFHQGYALHGAYWHDEFGKARSHGCVNLSPADAAWLFEWTDPVVPPDWHGVINKDRGTVVYVRP